MAAPPSTPTFFRFGGLAYVLGLFASATLLGGTLGLAGLALGALGIQIARKG